MKTILPQCHICTNQVKKKTKKFCSTECYRVHQRSGNYKTREAKHVYSCHNCSCEVKRQPSRKRNGEISDKVFCGRDCYDVFHKLKLATFKCKGCGKDCTKQACTSTNTYCTNECRRKFRVTSCITCSIEFSAIKYRNTGNGYARVVARVCSKDCLHSFYRNDKSRKEKIGDSTRGDKNHKWNGGLSKHASRGAQWGAVREGCFSSKGENCEICDLSRIDSKEKYGCDLHIDHINAWHECESEDEANDIKNLRPLCMSCHAKIGSKASHGKYVKKNKTLESMIASNRSKVTVEQFLAVKADYVGDGKSYSNIKEVSIKHNISLGVIRAIMNGKHWLNEHI